MEMQIEVLDVGKEVLILRIVLENAVLWTVPRLIYR